MRGIVFAEEYSAWSMDQSVGTFDGPESAGPWQVMGPLDAAERMPLTPDYEPSEVNAIRVEGSGVVPIVIRCEPGSTPRTPITQTRCAPGVYGGFYCQESQTFPAGRHPLFRMVIQVG